MDKITSIHPSTCPLSIHPQMMASFKSLRRNLRYLRVLMFLFLITAFGIGLYFILFSAEGVITVVSILSLVLIFLITLIFLGYDTLRDQQQTSSSLLLESKRLFIKYISHEIRSPLNTVYLGLKLLNQEMQRLNDSLAGSDEMDPSVRSTLDEWVALIDDVEESTDRGQITLKRSTILQVSDKSTSIYESVFDHHCVVCVLCFDTLFSTFLYTHQWCEC